MKFPLHLSFKILALASQIYIRDSDGGLAGYVKQKLFKLREEIKVYKDENQTEVRYHINADRVIDFSANYVFSNSLGGRVGSLKRQGVRSLWKADYDINSPEGALVMKINEENGWVKVVDALVGSVPFVGFFSGYIFNPTYLVTRTDGTPVVRLVKDPAFLESRFTMNAVGSMTDSEEELVLLSCLTMVLLERARG